ncbi:MAG: glycoside hydrolase family 3 N-terminal domain-containing protein, partial [Saprospiraceae bacterium]
MRIFLFYVLIFISLFSVTEGYGQSLNASIWVDSVFRTMTLDQKIGQLFMIRAHSDLGEDHISSVKSQIKKYNVGGLCFFQGTPEKQATLTAEYQKLSKIPMMVSMDAEWGLGMRLKTKALSFPHQLMLGAVQDVDHIEAMGFAIGNQLKALGVQVSFSPVADINNNALNPVIGDRSFGEDKYDVSSRAVAYMKGLKASGVMASGKHFPGHGDTDVDSHFDLPVISHSMERLKDIELYPFQQLIDAGLPSMMVAHLHVPAIDSTPLMSSTLSSLTINDLLKTEMGFKGLVFTDGLEMKGVTKNYDAGEVATMAFNAGNDILLLSDNIDLAFTTLKKGFKSGNLNINLLNEKVRKILEAKYNLGLDSLVLPTVETASAMAFDPYAVGIKDMLIEEAITVVQNKRALIPMVNLQEPKIATLSIGSAQPTVFQNRLDSYVKAKQFFVPLNLADIDIPSLLKDLKGYSRVIVSIHALTNKPADNFGLTKDILQLVQNLNRQQEIIVVIFGSPYSLKFFENIDHLIMAYEDSPETEDIAAQGLVGVFGFKGKLPITASNIFPLHQGYTTPSLKRLGYSVPERVGMCSDSLKMISDIVDQMIKVHAAPGCQVLIAREGRIIYEKAFGQHTYEPDDPVYLTDLYDLASVTKVAATTLSVMRLYQEGILSIHKTLGDYLPWLKGSNKENMLIDRVMAHHAGLQSWIPFYEATLPQYRLRHALPQDIYCSDPDSKYCIPVAQDMFMEGNYIDSMRQQIYFSGLNQDGQYVYSDLGFIMLAEIIKRETGVTLDQYVDSVFYKPMGLDRIGFKPLERFSPDEIVPSEYDDYFRCQVVQGYVHDMTSAMLGGVSGHAGLFSNAEDLAVLFQMLMNKGYYGGQQYLDPNVIDVFTSRYQNSTRRGIGFDMKELDHTKSQLTSMYSSPSTYGHTGFTGICVWNDPQSKLVYVFLSNRTYPSMHNGLLSTYNIRERIHSRAYRAIEGFKGYTHEMI